MADQSLATSDDSPHLQADRAQETDTADPPQHPQSRRMSLLRKIFPRGEDDDIEPEVVPRKTSASLPNEQHTTTAHPPQTASADSVISRKVIPSLPRPQTFRRQNSEQRDKLEEVPIDTELRRALSPHQRRDRACSGASLGCQIMSQLTEEPPRYDSITDVKNDTLDWTHSLDDAEPLDHCDPKYDDYTGILPPVIPPPSVDDYQYNTEDEYDAKQRLERILIEEQHDKQWILNLSMRFRDNSNREKLYVTYAQKPSMWRRITISLDYRDPPLGSLEADLRDVPTQREKSFRIYDAIRETLPDIRYYDTVTNLRLETDLNDGQLHVHVREDANEIIHFPSIGLFDHVRCPRFNDSTLEFDSHLSGFVYKVRLNGKIVIKKEIPGPGSVDEFIYEVNALDALLDASHVVKLVGLVTDGHGTHVKGLLIEYAPQGAMIDMLYDFRGSEELRWPRREKWARQIVGGLSEIHEAGFVQGDFTLTNIVIDDDDNAIVIDVNRRGCPIGWEPPEILKLVENGQQVALQIGVKTDLFQLGMVLWALAEEVDDPENVRRPLPDVEATDIPEYYREMVKICLSDRTQDRLDAKALLEMFPADAGRNEQEDLLSSGYENRNSGPSPRSSKQYVDPNTVVTIDDIQQERSSFSNLASGQVSYLNPSSNPTSTTYAMDSTDSWHHNHRGRSTRRRASHASLSARSQSSATSVSEDSAGVQECLDGETASSEHRLNGLTLNDNIAEVTDRNGTSADDTEEDNSTINGSSDTADGRPSTAVKTASKRVSALQEVNSVRMSELLHKDSGFDEHMETILNEPELDKGKDIVH